VAERAPAGPSNRELAERAVSRPESPRPRLTPPPDPALAEGARRLAAFVDLRGAYLLMRQKEDRVHDARAIYYVALDSEKPAAVDQGRRAADAAIALRDEAIDSYHLEVFHQFTALLAAKE
jgi:hypothetical protein